MWHPHSNKPQKICRVNHFKINFQPHTAHFCDDKIFRLPVKMTRSLQFFSWYSIPALRLNASIKAVSCNTCNWGKTLLKNDIINNKIWIILARQRANCAQTNYIIRDANLWRSQIWRFFLDQYPPPTEFANATTPPKVLFWFGPPFPLPPSPQAILWEKCQSNCQGLQLVEYSSNQTHFYRSNKKETLFFLFATNNVHHARKWSQKL